MSFITWIIIVLIIVSIGVTVSEVILRFALLEKEKGKGRVVGSRLLLKGPVADMLDMGGNATLATVGRGLSAEEVGALCGMDTIGKTFADMGYC
jgi:hypothetical protein